MSSKAILRRLKRLEEVFAVEPVDDWLDIVMWMGADGGIFGHMRYRFSKSRNETEWIPCSDEEEIEAMRIHYEKDGQRLYCNGPRVSLAEYLEHFSYLGSEELGARRKRIIERLKSENGRA